MSEPGLFETAYRSRKKAQRDMERRTRMYSPERTADGRSVVYIWHVRIEGESHELAVRATHLHIDEDAWVFLLDHNFADAVMFVAPRERTTYVQRYAAVTAPAEKS